MNTRTALIPTCLFYADDGIILTNSEMDTQAKLQVVEAWSHSNRMMLNVRKCGVVTQCKLPTLYIDNQEVLSVLEFTYLGFPVSSAGIDFPKYLNSRMEAAVNQARWLGIQVNS